MIDQRQEVRRRQNVDVFTRPGGFVTRGLRADEPLAHRVRTDRSRQRPRDSSDRAVERQLSDGRVGGNRVRGDRFHRRHHRQHDRQIEVAAFFRQIGRRQIDCNVLEEQAVQRVADTLAASIPMNASVEIWPYMKPLTAEG